MPSEPSDAVDARVVKALSHPTRRRILDLLQHRELASPVELAQELGIPLGTVSYHVRRLDQLGFIELARRTQRRGAVEHHYRARDVLDAPRRRRRRPGEGDAAALVRATLDAAQRALPRGGFDAVQARADARELRFDEQGCAEARALLAQFAATVDRVEQVSMQRLAAGAAPKPGERAHEATALVLLFPTGG